jgi:hypothetical protein
MFDYLDFTWFITDDFSVDDTKQKLLNKIQKIMAFNIRIEL